MNTMTCSKCSREFDDREPVTDEALQAIGLSSAEIDALREEAPGYTSRIQPFMLSAAPGKKQQEINVQLVCHCQRCWAELPWAKSMIAIIKTRQ